MTQETMIALACSVAAAFVSGYFCYRCYRKVETMADAITEASRRGSGRRRSAVITRIPRPRADDTMIDDGGA